MMTRDADLAAAIRHHQAGRLDEAEAGYRALIAANPDDATPRHLLGIILLGRNQPEAALVELERAAPGLPDSAQLHADLGRTLFALGQYARAAPALRRSLALTPRQASLWHLLGRTLAFLGETEDAADCLRRCLSLAPDHVGALRDLAASGTTEVIAPLRRILARPDLAGMDRIHAGFALATALDQAEAYDEAFSVLRAANAALRRHLASIGHEFNSMALASYVSARVAAYPPGAFASSLGDPSPKPVFVVGLPRSGTTLVERILASHPRVTGLGEGNTIGNLAAELERASGGLGAESAEAARPIAAAHLAWLDTVAPGAERVVDKTPDNLFHLGAITRLFPNARIILCRRDPRDVCLSCHFQGFAMPMPYANDLGDCVIRLREADRMIRHWRAVLPRPMLEIQYESLATDPEATAKAMLAFLDLPWDPSCLSFHEHPGVVTSASVWQVRRPVHRASIHRWRHYARHLGPVLAAFGRGEAPAA